MRRTWGRPSLSGRTAVVTGANRGLGRRIAEAFLAEGCRVVATVRQERAAAGLLDAAGDHADRIAVHQVDVREPESVRRLMRFASDCFGGVDILVANAGVSRPGPVNLLAPEHWAVVLETNLTGVFHCAQAAIPYLERSAAGRVITVSSALATRVAPGASAYCASKAAVEMFTRVCAIELADRGITVNCLAPGLIDEGMGRQLAGNEPVWAQYRPKLAMGRMGRADEVAAAALFLAGEDSSYVNGHILEVNGGLRW
jgi:3-oxoacyl-[acyl-carrier protein] reductase